MSSHARIILMVEKITHINVEVIMAKKNNVLTLKDRQKGGRAVLEKYGRKHFSEMKKKYWRDRKKREKNEKVLSEV